jgi:hypothetical protein
LCDLITASLRPCSPIFSRQFSVNSILTRIDDFGHVALLALFFHFISFIAR